MRFLPVAVVAAILCGFAGLAATAPARRTTKKAAPSSRKKAASGRTKTAASTTKTPSRRTKLAKSRTTKPRAPVSTWRTRQQVPTPERYQEIQQALIDKGYLKGDATGVWDANSIDALTRFQTQQKLNVSGKIDAASLIGLGLGAKSAGAPEAPPLASAPAAPSPPVGLSPVPAPSVPAAQ